MQAIRVGKLRANRLPQAIPARQAGLSPRPSVPPPVTMPKAEAAALLEPVSPTVASAGLCEHPRPSAPMSGSSSWSSNKFWTVWRAEGARRPSSRIRTSAIGTWSERIAPGVPRPSSPPPVPSVKSVYARGHVSA